MFIVTTVNNGAIQEYTHQNDRISPTTTCKRHVLKPVTPEHLE